MLRTKSKIFSVDVKYNGQQADAVSFVRNGVISSDLHCVISLTKFRPIYNAVLDVYAHCTQNDYLFNACKQNKGSRYFLHTE